MGMRIILPGPELIVPFSFVDPVEDPNDDVPVEPDAEPEATLLPELFDGMDTPVAANTPLVDVEEDPVDALALVLVVLLHVMSNNGVVATVVPTTPNAG